MKYHSVVVITLVLVCLGCTQTRNDTDFISPATANAALEYYRAFLLLDYLPDGMKDVNNPDYSKLTESNKRAIQLDRDDDLWILMNATKLPDCDWGDHCSNGPETYLPQIAPHKRMALLLYYNAMLHIENNEIDDAIESIAAIIRMAHHLVISDDVAVTALTAKRELEYAKLAIESIPPSRIDPTHREKIVEPLNRFEKSDPLEMRANALGEIHCFSAWVRVTTAGMNYFELRNFFLSWINTFMPKPNISISELLLITNPNTLPGQIDLFDALEQDVRRAFDHPEAIEQLERIFKAVQHGEYGAVPKIFYAVTPSYKQYASEGEQLLEELKSLLTK